MEENFAEGKKEKEESCRPLIRDAGRYGLDGTSGQSFGNLTAFTRDWMTCTTVCL